jgi:hypothetical protein
LLILLPSCGGGDDGRPKRYPTTGRVAVDGKGTAGIQIRLHPVGRTKDLDALRPAAVTGEEGVFRLGTYEEADGAPAGNYKVTLYWPDSPNSQSRPSDLFGGKYGKPDASTIEVTVKEGETDLGTIEASKDASKPKPQQATPRKDAARNGPGPDGPNAR